jgi:hypothetical protein
MFAVYVAGYLVCCINIVVWTNYYTRISRWLRSSDISPSLRRLVKIANLTIILPVGIFMCVGPLFSPFAALSLSQQVLYDHNIDSRVLI